MHFFLKSKIRLKRLKQLLYCYIMTLYLYGKPDFQWQLHIRNSNCNYVLRQCSLDVFKRSFVNCSIFSLELLLIFLGMQCVIVLSIIILVAWIFNKVSVSVCATNPLLLVYKNLHFYDDFTAIVEVCMAIGHFQLIIGRICWSKVLLSFVFADGSQCILVEYFSLVLSVSYAFVWFANTVYQKTSRTSENKWWKLHHYTLLPQLSEVALCYH